DTHGPTNLLPHGSAPYTDAIAAVANPPSAKASAPHAPTACHAAANDNPTHTNGAVQATTPGRVAPSSANASAPTRAAGRDGWASTASATDRAATPARSGGHHRAVRANV